MKSAWAVATVLAFSIMVIGSVSSADEPAGGAVREDPGEERMHGAAGVAQEAQERAEHKVDGTITEVEKKTGRVVLDTPSGPLEVHFPQRAVQDLESGERITVLLSYVRGKAPEADVRAQNPERGSIGTEPETFAQGTHWLQGEVTGLDPNTGHLSMRSEGLDLKLQFPPEDLRGLQEGEQISVQLSFTGPEVRASDAPND